MRNLVRVQLITILLLTMFCTVVAAAVKAPVISNIRLGDDVTKSRLVIDVSSIPQYAVSVDKGGKQLKLLMFDTIAANGVHVPEVKGNVVKQIIMTNDGPSTLLTIELSEAMPYKAFVLNGPARVVLDISKEYEKIKTTAKADGLNLTEYFHSDASGPLTAYFLDIDPAKYNVTQSLAGGFISAGCRTVKTMAMDNNAIAAVNGGYFSYDGVLIGCSRINGKTAGTIYYNRTSMGRMRDGSWKMGTVDYSGEVTIGGVTLPVSGVNCPRGENNLTLYNSNYGNTTDTNIYGQEYVVYNGKVTAIAGNNGKIPANGVIVSVHGASAEALKNVKVGDKAEITEVFGGELSDAVEIIGAGPELLRDGVVHVTSSDEQFPSDIAVGRAPRTAMGIMKNGHIMLAVIDGRQAHSIGATLTETAQLMKKFGAVDAMNLDGGGSSEMVLSGQVLNSPSDGRERAVASGIVVKTKAAQANKVQQRTTQQNTAKK